jgi:DNA segregation ATPase FtsK/SpoIIIE, S-DNA-T family
MAVTVYVSDVREQIYRAAGGASSVGAGAPSTALLGQLFADLTSGDAKLNLRAALDEAAADREQWRSALVGHTYRRLVGPRLRRHQAALHHVSAQALNFWQAVQEMCGWLAEALWQARECGYALDEMAAMLSVEQPLKWTLRQPGWTDEVLLVGRLDALWTSPSARRLIIELKTGRTAPEADLAQACLYQQMLAASGFDEWGTLALVSFTPQCGQALYAAESLQRARTSLIDLIGRTAGVLPQGRDGDSERGPSERPPTPPEPEAQPPTPPAPLTPAHRTLREQVLRAFAEYGVEVGLSEAPTVGPTFLRFFVTPGPRVTPARVMSLAEPLQVRLRLDAPPHIGIEGGQVTLDIQRPDRQTVYFSSIRGQLPSLDPLGGSAQVPVGVGLDGKLLLADFRQSAHLLVAGIPGSGKSEWLRSAIAGLLLANTPDTLRLLLIDPKRNAFQLLHDSPFLYAPLVFPDEQPVTEVLTALVEEMGRRYLLLSETKSDTLSDHVRRTGQPIPRIFCVCDEYADLLLMDRQQRREVEQLITRLGSKARAAGIHLILATQQPSREIIRGMLDATIEARVGLKMQRGIESRMLLNEAGAESLLGRGDLLFKSVSRIVRLQSPYLPEAELKAVFGQTARGEAA